ncbi:MAG: PEP-CTERM sorting domain-containing protein [Methylobacter sp.]|nr:PEP-CTERM sorting domain-containing protein [Methylobacter sp.]
MAAIGQPLPPAVSRSVEATTAYAMALPQVADAQAALEGQPQIRQNFDLGGSGTALLLADMGVLNTATTSGLHNYQSLLNLSINTASIANPQELLIGFLNPVFGNDNFLAGDSLTFSYSISGGASNVSNSFTFDSSNISSGYDFFNDKTLDIGSLASLVDSNHTLNLAFNLELQSQIAGAGLNLGLIVGNGSVSAVPLPASIWLLGSALAGIFSLNRRKNFRRLPINLPKAFAKI